jgi:hypothetical protein
MGFFFTIFTDRQIGRTDALAKENSSGLAGRIGSNDAFYAARRRIQSTIGKDRHE